MFLYAYNFLYNNQFKREIYMYLKSLSIHKENSKENHNGFGVFICDKDTCAFIGEEQVNFFGVET